MKVKFGAGAAIVLTNEVQGTPERWSLYLLPDLYFREWKFYFTRNWNWSVMRFVKIYNFGPMAKFVHIEKRKK